MTFTRPAWLLLSLALPPVLWLGWPRRARGRAVASLTIRVTLLTLLILALSGFSLQNASRNLDVVFVLDWSDSLPDQAKAQALAYVQQALKAKAPDDRAAVIVFGQDALVEHLLARETALEGIASLPNPAHTDLEEALSLAFTLLPPENARRIVVLTDGAYTTGNPQSIASLIRNSGIDLRFVCYPFGEVRDPAACHPPVYGQADAAITAVHLPTSVHTGETFPLEVTLHGQNAPVNGQLEVRTASGTLLHREAHTIRPGTEHLTLSLQAADSPGLLAYTVEFIPTQSDFYPENNQLQGYTTVLGAPRLLLVAPSQGETIPGEDTPRPDEAAALYSVLQNSGMQVERALPWEMPASLLHLGRYDAVVLVDVPASQLDQAQMQAIQQYVRDLGGGLVVIGGPTAFGVGGYYHTPLENALPLEMQIKDEQKRPRMAILYVIDHSGSMMETSGGPTKLNLAKEAAIRSVDMLMNGDQVGVVAFDDTASWAVPVQTLEDPVAIQSAISHISGGGGTDIYAGLYAASQVIPKIDAPIRHIILLTDGGADPTGIPELVQRLHTQENVTLTTIAVGSDATPNLKEWAKLGEGRYYFVDKPSRLPDVFTAETALVSRSYVVEEPFTPIQTAPSALLPDKGLPPLYGYVATQARRTAQVILQSPKEDPILATWRYGLGKALAFTSDATGRWGRDWLAWQGYATFWSAAVRSVLGAPVSGDMQAEVNTDGEHARLTVTLLQDIQPGEYALEASIVPPGGSDGLSLTLSQESPAQFSAQFTPQEPGVYLLHVQGHAPNGESLTLTTGWAYGYSSEYRPQSASDRLNRLLLGLDANAPARLLQQMPEETFAHDVPAPPRRRAMWYPLLALAAALLPLDVAVRRLAFSREDIQGWRASLKAWRTRKSAPTPQGTRVRTLLRVKRRPRGTPSPPQARPKPPSKPAEPRPPQRPASQKPVSPSQHTAQALLRRKREREDKT